MKLSELLAIEDGGEFAIMALEHGANVTANIIDVLDKLDTGPSKLENRTVEVMSVAAYNTLRFVVENLIAGKESNQYAVYSCILGIVESAFMAGQLGVNNLVKLCESEE